MPRWLLAILIAVGVLIFFGIAIVVFSGPETTTTTAPRRARERATSTTLAPTTTTKFKTVRVGEPLIVGEVRWTAGTPEKTEVIDSGSEFTEDARANGIFVIVPLTAELIGQESGTIDESQFRVVDSKGRRFAPTDNVDVSIILGDKEIFLKQVNPNVPVSGVAVFDIAKDATGLRLEIKDLRLTSEEKGYIDLGF